MKVQHLRQGRSGLYGAANICSGSHIHDLSTNCNVEALAKHVTKCNGRRGFLIVGNNQHDAKSALAAIAKSNYRFQDQHGHFRFRVRRLGKWSPLATMFSVRAEHA